MKIRTWMIENAAVVSALVVVFRVAQLPLTPEMFGWALGVFAAHSSDSHAGRKAEKAGQGQDLLAECFKWLGGASLVLAAASPARVLVLVPLARAVLFAIWRFTYRRRHPARPRVRHHVPRRARYSTHFEG